MDNLLARMSRKEQHGKRLGIEPVGANLLRQVLQADHST
jgi:hypothetical protein